LLRATILLTLQARNRTQSARQTNYSGEESARDRISTSGRLGVSGPWCGRRSAEPSRVWVDFKRPLYRVLQKQFARAVANHSRS